MTKNAIANELMESGYTNVKFDMKDCHAFYFTMDEGEAKFIIEQDEEIYGQVHTKENGSEDWYYWATLDTLEEE